MPDKLPTDVPTENPGVAFAKEDTGNAQQISTNNTTSNPTGIASDLSYMHRRNIQYFLYVM